MKKLSIIYDVTAFCPWNCNICCMGANPKKTCIDKELSLEEKLNVKDQIKELSENGYDVRIDLSGGEIFAANIPDHKMLISGLSEVIGREKIGISCSGYNINKDLAGFLSMTVHDVEMTMDVSPCSPYKLRPNEYSNVAAKAVTVLKKAGCKVGLQTVASSYNSSYDDALSVYSWACRNKVDNWSILRFFPSGRGSAFPQAAMSDDECRAYVKMIQKMTEELPTVHKPKVDFHYLMPGHEKYTHECRCVKRSIGILPNGNVVACFWALDNNTDIIDPKFMLGNVKENTLLEILNSEKAHYWTDSDHCCELSSDFSNKKTERSGSFDVLSA